MDFKVRAKKLDGGRYQLNYGRGKAKLTDVAWNNDVAGGWQLKNPEGFRHPVNEEAPYQRLKDLKEAWGRWASDTYGGGNGSGKPGIEHPPAKAPPKGPPSFKHKGPPSFKRKAGGPPPIKKPKAPVNDVPTTRLQEVMDYVTEKLEQESADFREARPSLVATANRLKELADAYVEAERRRKPDPGDPDF